MTAPLIIMIVTFVGYVIAYKTYGRFIAQKLFQLNPNNKVPAIEQADGKDFIASKKEVTFGHHFTSIAGTGPIVGPAIGIIWGWVPALLWVFLGSIFMGAVHDFSALVISMRHQGRSISDITGDLISKKVRLMFFCIVFLALLIVIAIFGMIIAIIFDKFPTSVIAVWIEIPIAIIFGFWGLKKKSNLLLATSIAVIGLYLFVWVGYQFPISLASFDNIPITGTWTIILLLYAFIASVLPVDLLLQPRDYLNAWQLYISIALVLLGIVITGLTGQLEFVAPAVNLDPKGAPPILPFLFITIACGALSGFHCLICSGTTAKQIESEKDAQLVGFGSMLTEGALAIVVIIAVAAGIGIAYPYNGEKLVGIDAFQIHYSSWQASAGLGSKLTAVVIGMANMMNSFGIPIGFGAAIVGVFIASFAGTTLDSATRVQRYVISELMTNLNIKRFNNKWVATSIAVLTALVLAFSSGIDGKGALTLWPLFGAVNQLLGGLALLVATVYLNKRVGIYSLVTAIPCVLIMIMTMWASGLNQWFFILSKQYVLIIINGLILLMSLVISLETLKVIGKKQNGN